MWSFLMGACAMIFIVLGFQFEGFVSALCHVWAGMLIGHAMTEALNKTGE
jgi:hypothetical protein